MKDRIVVAARAARGAVVANWRPFLLVQLVAVALVAAYYLVPGAAGATAALAAFKVRGGYLFSGLGMAITGGLLPEVAKRVTRMPSKKLGIGDLLFQMAVFAFLGVSIDALYRWLGHLFGLGVTPQIVAEKVFFDQLFFAPFVSISFSTTVFLWRDAGFDAAKTKQEFHNGNWLIRYTSLLVMCWAFWFPVLACVYAMPPNLQFCLGLCAQTAWGLLLLWMSAPSTQESSDATDMRR